MHNNCLSEGNYLLSNDLHIVHVYHCVLYAIRRDDVRRCLRRKSTRDMDQRWHWPVLCSFSNHAPTHHVSNDGGLGDGEGGKGTMAKKRDGTCESSFARSICRRDILTTFDWRRGRRFPAVTIGHVSLHSGLFHRSCDSWYANTQYYGLRRVA